MPKCVKCGYEPPPHISPERAEQVKRGLAVLEQHYPGQAFTGKQACPLFEVALKLDHWAAGNLWNSIRAGGYLEGMEGHMTYRWWRVKIA